MNLNFVNCRINCKQIFISILGLFFLLVSCEKDDINNALSESDLLNTEHTLAKKNKSKITICHYSINEDVWKLIDINVKAWDDHKSHGDVRLDDQDNDGMVPYNECGFGGDSMGDCDDTNGNIRQNTYYADFDGDSYGDLNKSIEACIAPEGYVSNNSDCDDTDKTIHQMSTYYKDADGDSYGDPKVFSEACLIPEGYVDNDFDFDDNDATLYPGATEICDGKDNNGNADIDEGCDPNEIDDDGDGMTENEGDCDDTDSTIYVGAPEICDGKDNNCNGQIDEGLTMQTYYQDFDGDTFGNPNIKIIACSIPEGFVLDNTDCNDQNSTIHPGAYEIRSDNIDQNCDGKDLDSSGRPIPIR